MHVRQRLSQAVQSAIVRHSLMDYGQKEIAQFVTANVANASRSSVTNVISKFVKQARIEGLAGGDPPSNLYNLLAALIEGAAATGSDWASAGVAASRSARAPLHTRPRRWISECIMGVQVTTLSS